jgi:hypothetical protein
MKTGMKFLGLVTAVLLVSPGAAQAHRPRAHAALTCTSSVTYPQYHWVSNPPKVDGTVKTSCDSGANIQDQGCVQQNWGAGWYTVTQSCGTTSYGWTSSRSLTTSPVNAYCGRWYRLWMWHDVNGHTGTLTGNASYVC